MDNMLVAGWTQNEDDDGLKKKNNSFRQIVDKDDISPNPSPIITMEAFTAPCDVSGIRILLDIW